jgi:hypothetical protein
MRLVIVIVSILLAIALGIVWLLEVEHEQTQEISKLKAEVSHCAEQHRPNP